MLIKCLLELHFLQICIYDIKTETKCYYIHYSVLWKRWVGRGGLSTVPLGGSKSHFTLPLEWRIYATESFFLSLNFSTSIFISIELAHEVLLCLLIKHLYVYYYFKSQFCVIFLWFFVNDFYLMIKKFESFVCPSYYM